MLPPDEPTGLAVVQSVQSLNGAQLEQRVRAEVGDPLLAFFALLAKSMAPQDDDGAIAKKVHLMVLAYLVRGELDAVQAPPAPKAPPPKAPPKKK